jgi:polyphosphate kinase 2 (PPK2 family)
VLLSGKAYDKELARLQEELVALQEWIKQTGRRLVVVFEGRDTAGKGGTIQRITAALNPAGADRAGEDRVVLPALPGPPAGGR